MLCFHKQVWQHSYKGATPSPSVVSPRAWFLAYCWSCRGQVTVALATWVGQDGTINLQKGLTRGTVCHTVGTALGPWQRGKGGEEQQLNPSILLAALEGPLLPGPVCGGSTEITKRGESGRVGTRSWA